MQENYSLRLCRESVNVWYGRQIGPPGRSFCKESAVGCVIHIETFSLAACDVRCEGPLQVGYELKRPSGEWRVAWLTSSAW